MSENNTRTRRKKIDDKDLGKLMGKIAQNVREGRIQSKLSQQALAERSGIAITTLSDIELAKAYNLKLSTLVSLARELKLKILDLLV
ncbi:MAG: helix-turn-helix transcriptional regulator [Bdellovibrionales bacterium]|nr:helix-turn-helix transcriptional regulator [Bdellovibrionales bacterium]